MITYLLVQHSVEMLRHERQLRNIETSPLRIMRGDSASETDDLLEVVSTETDEFRDSQ